MQPFTGTGSWTNGAQDLDGANEIITSYIEHRKVLGQSVAGINLLVEGDNAQDKNIWNTIQEWLEDNCTSFIDSETGPLIPDKSDFLYFIKAAWQTAAGLNVSAVGGESFRRKVNMEDGFSYGNMAIDDIRGDWCFEDLQNGFDKLKWTKQGGNYVQGFPTIEQKFLEWLRYFPGPNLAGFIAAYDALPWTARGPDNFYHISGGSQKTGGWYYTSARRFRASQTLSFPAINRKIDIYIKAQTKGSWLDYDGVGFVEGEYILYRSDAETSATTVTLALISDISTCPLEINPGTYSICSLGWFYYLEKWQFTYGED